MASSVKILLISMIWLGVWGTVSLAQQEFLPNEILPEISEMVALDEDLPPKDLGISDPRILPDHPLYFLKGFWRGLRGFLTFDPLRKAELKMKFASEKLIEAKKLADRGKLDLAKEILEKHQLDFDRIKETLKARKDDPRAKRLFEKMTEKIIKHQKILDKIEKEVPLKELPKIREIKEKIIKDLVESQDPQVLAEKIEEIIEKEKGSDFRRLKSLQVLMRVKEKVPEPAQDAINKAIENQIKKLGVEFEKLPSESQAKLKFYLSTIGGDRARILEILSEIEDREISPQIRENIEKAREKVLEKIKARMEKAEKEKVPEYFKKVLDRLKAGEIKKLEILDRLEKEAPVGILDEILKIKREARENLAKKLKNIPPEKKKEFLEKVAKRSNLTTLKILKEQKEMLPEKERKEIEKLEEKIKEVISADLERASLDPEILNQKVQRFLRGFAEETKIIPDLPVKPWLQEKLKRNLKEKIVRRLEIIEDPERLERLKQKLEERKIEISPEIIEKRKELAAKITPERVKERIETAQRLLKEVEEKLKLQKEKMNLPLYKKIWTLNNLAENQVREAEKLLKEGKTGQAWGKVTAGLVKIKEILRMLEELHQLTTVRPPVGPVKPPIVPEESPVVPEEKLCIQVLTPAIGPEGECRVFPTSCDVPEGWKRVDKCPTTQPE